MSLEIRYLFTPKGLLKIFELVFVIITFGIFRGGNASFGGVDANFFACGVLVTGLIITPLLMVCYIMGRIEIEKTILEPALNFLLFAFLFSASVVAFDKFSGSYHSKLKSQSLAMASFCLFASVAYLGDFVLSVIKFRE